MLVDQAIIHVKAGKGGDGSVSFRREAFVPKGGPDGGQGGNGGNVILHANPNVATLLDMIYKPHHHADNGRPGAGRSQYGANADDLIIELPPGTIIFNEDTGQIMVDLNEPDMSYTIAKGGKGGKGNEAFKTATNQTPREAEPGEPGEEFSLRLELKLIADVGLVGKPNAGKSTLLRAVSKARPKTADYPFTTLSPQLGVVALDGERRIVVADIPGLIEGAAEGAGLGHDFLRHIERTRTIVHVIEIEPTDGTDPIENYHVIRKELSDYSEILANKPYIIALNKTDLLGGTDDDNAIAKQLIEDELQLPVYTISAATGDGVRELMEKCWKLVKNAKLDDLDTI